MAYRYIHQCRKYVDARGEWFYFYRFPYSDEAKARLLELPIAARYWRPEYKAWGVHEDHASEIEEFLTKHFALPMCPWCTAETCRAWTHLGAEQPRPRRAPHWETPEERARAQAQYDQQSWKNQAYGQRHYQQGQYQRYQGWQDSAQQDPFAATEPPPPKTKPAPADEKRWAPPERGRPDIDWCRQVLGLTFMVTSKAELKAVYRRLALEYHPDLNHELEGDSSKMALINVARDYLDQYLS
jgi:hypothetical protein